MRQARWHLRGVTRVERLTAMSRLEAAIGRLDGWLLDFHLFSNLAAAFHFEIPPERRGQLLVELEEEGFSIDPPVEGIDPSAVVTAAQETKEVPVTLQVTFLHNEPDLRRKIPPLPG
jgi:hypothetical protein